MKQELFHVKQELFHMKQELFHVIQGLFWKEKTKKLATDKH